MKINIVAVTCVLVDAGQIALQGSWAFAKLLQCFALDAQRFTGGKSPVWWAIRVAVRCFSRIAHWDACTVRMKIW